MQWSNNLYRRKNFFFDVISKKDLLKIINGCLDSQEINISYDAISDILICLLKNFISANNLVYKVSLIKYSLLFLGSIKIPLHDDFKLHELWVEDIIKEFFECLYFGRGWICLNSDSFDVIWKIFVLLENTVQRRSNLSDLSKVSKMLISLVKWKACNTCSSVLSRIINFNGI